MLVGFPRQRDISQADHPFCTALGMEAPSLSTNTAFLVWRQTQQAALVWRIMNVWWCLCLGYLRSLLRISIDGTVGRL